MQISCGDTRESLYLAKIYIDIYIYNKYMVSLAISSNSLQENKQVNFSNYSFQINDFQNS